MNDTHTRVVRPTRVRGEDLDQYLARGWYRIGHTMMTCRFVYFGDTLRSAIWTRLPLQGHRFRRSHRRTMNRIERDLAVQVVRPVVDDEHEAVYQRYRAHARGERSTSLTDFLFGDRSHRTDIFDTWEVRFVGPGGELVGFSWFDVGERAIQSLVGVYDPSVSQLGLGFGSMLYEIRWAMERGLHWFYPGYVLPGDPAMDYKLRVGDVEFLDGRGDWRPWSDFDPDDIPTTEVRHRLDAVGLALAEMGIGSELQVYPMFEAPAWHANLSNCLSDPLVLLVPGGAPRSVLVITWDLERQAYRIRRCMQAAAISRSVHDDDEGGTPVTLLVVLFEALTDPDPEVIARRIPQELQRLYPR